MCITKMMKDNLLISKGTELVRVPLRSLVYIQASANYSEIVTGNGKKTLVSEGRAIDNEPKGKAIRKAICDRNGEIMVIMSAGRESFHDFAQALADFGVDNAVYLVGSELSYGFCRDGQGRFIPFSQKHRDSQKYENYIVWRKK